MSTYKSSIMTLCTCIEMRMIDKRDAADALAVQYDIDVGKATWDIAKIQEELAETDAWKNSTTSKMYERKILKNPEVE